MNSKICILIFLVAAVAIATSEKFCPPPRDPSPCNLRSKWNDCCKQSDCRSFDICCSEPCGNVCRRATDKPTTGVAFRDGDYCVEGWEE
uniref:U17-Eretoxin-Ek1g_1 n=1 Tax=Eresus cinnaberinus TaxID=175337 RepID=A0A2D0PC00_ERECI